MNDPELEVAIMDGETMIQHWPCRRTAMPDGTPGVMWRGVAYALQPGDRIDISASESEEPASPSASHLVLPGDEASWVLIQGLADTVTQAGKTLIAGGITVSRSGRWMGEQHGPIAFDWFLRCTGRLDPQLVSRLLGQAEAPPDAMDSAARLAVLEQRIADLLATVADLGRALQRPVEREPAHPPDPPPEPDHDLQQARAELEALRASFRVIETSLPARTASAALAPKPTRATHEVTAILHVLRPDIVLVRDSLAVALGEFHTSSGLYKALAELPPYGSRPDGWKMLRGAERWWECHVSTGRNDHGRVYARFDTGARQWHVLLGWKVEQTSDIAWLKRLG